MCPTSDNITCSLGKGRVLLPSGRQETFLSQVLYAKTWDCEKEASRKALYHYFCLGCSTISVISDYRVRLGSRKESK